MKGLDSGFRRNDDFYETVVYGQTLFNRNGRGHKNMGWELKWMEWANEWWSLSFLDQILPWLTYLGSHFAVILFIILTWILTKQKKVLRRLLLLYGFQSAVIYGLKFLVNRERPLFFLEMASKLSKGPGEILDPSFPSGHAVLALMMATLLADRFPQYRFVFFTVAAFIGWTRVYLGLHYPTDVIAGALLGYGITRVYIFFYFSRKDGRGTNNT